MKSETIEISIRINKKQARKINQELHECGAYKEFYIGNKYSELRKLHDILNGNFESSKSGIHYIE